MRSTSSTQPSFCDASLFKSCMEKSDHYSFNPTLTSWHDSKENYQPKFNRYGRYGLKATRKTDAVIQN